MEHIPYRYFHEIIEFEHVHPEIFQSKKGIPNQRMKIKLLNDHQIKSQIWKKEVVYSRLVLNS